MEKNFVRIRSSWGKTMNKEVDPMVKYTLTDLSMQELAMIYQNREYEKSGRKYGNYLAGSIILSFLLAVILPRWTHNIFIALLAFVPIIAFFIVNHIRNRKIGRIVKQMVGQTIVDRSLNQKKGEPVEPV